MTENSTAPKTYTDNDGKTWVSHPRPAHVPDGKVWIPGTTIIMDAPAEDSYVVAEDAPLGVQLWPTRSPEYADNFTLESVEVKTYTLRSERGNVDQAQVIWTYRNGNTRTFTPGEQVAVRYVH